jgi:exonuclease III
VYLDLLVIVIYSPGSENITNSFFDNFADLLERVAEYASPLLIVGDLNVHLGDATDFSSSSICWHLMILFNVFEHRRTYS